MDLVIPVFKGNPDSPIWDELKIPIYAEDGNRPVWDKNMLETVRDNFSVIYVKVKNYQTGTDNTVYNSFEAMKKS